MTNRDTTIKKEDLNNFGSFFRTHYARLLNYCKYFVKDTTIAEDIVQETFIHFWEKRMSLDPNSSKEALLFISLRNRCLNFIRDQKYTAKKIEELKTVSGALQSISQIDYLGEEDIPLEEQLLQELNKAIEDLPDRCGEIIKLTKLEGLKNREVAVRLGISVKAVERQLSIGKKKIEQHFKENYPVGMALFLLWFS